ncbi:uncharacterized protein LOC116844499 isoform X2 [Odontomachus brunneus]|nr:uncharacterized protein LOC116844499 isoform X2 [Odontomachus brunneus]
MRNIAGSLSPSPIRLCQMYFLIYVMLAIVSTTFSSAEINKHDGSKATHMKDEYSSVRSAKKSTISPYQRENNEVTGDRNHSANELVTTGDEKNSAALNRFLENVLKARNNLKWIDEDARLINHRSRPKK